MLLRNTVMDTSTPRVDTLLFDSALDVLAAGLIVAPDVLMFSTPPRV